MGIEKEMRERTLIGIKRREDWEKKREKEQALKECMHNLNRSHKFY